MSPVDFGACMIKLKMTGGDGCLPQGSMMEARLSLPMTLFPFLTFPNQKTNLIPTLRMGRPHRMLGLGLYISWLFVWHPAPYLSLDKICSCVFIHDYQINVTSFLWRSADFLFTCFWELCVLSLGGHIGWFCILTHPCSLNDFETKHCIYPSGIETCFIYRDITLVSSHSLFPT